MQKFSSRSARRIRDDVAGCLPYEGPDILPGDSTVMWPSLTGQTDFPRGTPHPDGHGAGVHVSETHPMITRLASQKSKRERRS